MPNKSETEAMQELAGLLWTRYLRERVREELNHEMNGYKAEVVANNGDGTLTVRRPFEQTTLTLKAAASLSGAVAGDQVLVVGIGGKSKALSNAFVLCKTDLSTLGGGGGSPAAASDVSYNNTLSGLTATNVQTAIDEVAGDIPVQPSDIGAQPEINVNGIIKGTGYGNVSAAVAGTDYQTPLVAGTDYATPAMIPTVPDASDANPQALGTANPGTSDDYSRADHVHQKPSYSAADVGLGNVANERQYSANNPPPYPVTSVNGATGAVTVAVPSASTTNPVMDGVSNPGSSAAWARGDHVHPSDTTRVPTSRTINGYDLTADRTLTAADVGALASGGTAVAANKLANVHTISASAEGWYKFLSITMGTYTRQTMILAIENNYTQSCGLLRIHTRRNTSGLPIQSVGWIASGNTHNEVRWDYADGTWTFYIQKGSTPAILYIQCLSKTTNSYGIWLSEAVAEPTTATVATKYCDVNANAGYWFTNVAVSAGEAQQILSVSDARITADHVLARVEFADPSYITTGYTWATAAGSFTLTGTATAATTANILLVRTGD